MRTVVCIRRITQELPGQSSKISPLDRNALEEALKLRDRFLGRITVITMDAPVARNALEEALAIGADMAVLLCDPACAGSDTLATSYMLSRAIRQLGGFDLILCGNESLAGATGQVGPQLAELLDLPCVTHVRSIQPVDESRIRVQKALEHGHMDIEVQLPAVLSVLREINRPRLPTVMGIMEAAAKEIKHYTVADVGADSCKIGLDGSPTYALRQVQKSFERGKDIFSGPPEESVRKAVARLKELGAI